MNATASVEHKTDDLGSVASSGSTSNSTMNSADAPQGSANTNASSARIRQQDIDRLRNRVDAVLANLVSRTSPVDTDGHSVGGTANGAFSAQQYQQEPIPHPDRELPEGAHWIVDPYGDQGQYEGELDDSLFPHGKFGTMKYTDGRIYAGSWNHGEWHGQGKATFSNGDTYEGQYHKDQRHGKGEYRWNDGRSYSGDFQMDQRHGRGLYRWPDGAFYDGDFQKGLRHGVGIYTFRDGSVYRGEWQRGKYHGHGECRWADGRVYKGQWHEGKAHGQGVEVRPDGSIRHEGEWEYDRPLRHQTSKPSPDNGNGTEADTDGKTSSSSSVPTTKDLLEL
eukprot:Nitzschia sp. Nitz4//scaffold64_size103689//87156//88160//NITZ4_004448-RA/size103689-processed-gene-0.90-mRNA-1//1//CDS//3329556166//6070//frame0